MAKIYAKCPNCNQIILTEENQEAGICENCKKAFITEKAIRLYKNGKQEDKKGIKWRNKHIWKSFGKGLLMVLECIGYLCYCLFFVWLFVDITDSIRKK